MAAFASLGPGEPVGAEPAGVRNAPRALSKQPAQARGPLRHGLRTAEPEAIRPGGEQLRAGHERIVGRDCREGAAPTCLVPRGAEEVSRSDHGAPRGAIHLRLSAVELGCAFGSGPTLGRATTAQA